MTAPPTKDDPMTDLLIVGAGFAGMYMLHKARSLGFTAQVVEAGDDVGGTWYWNRYPGARCDIESFEYSYAFDEALQQEWVWTERYAAQPEILSYARHVADRFDLRRDIRFNTRVVSAHFHEGTDGPRWRVGTEAGDTLQARWLVMATGCLSAARVPQLEGAERFRGRQLHTGRWPHEPVSFAGQRVGVIGTGSSGIQAIPMIAREAAELVVFQRTAGYSLPAFNRPLDPAVLAEVKSRYPELRRTARESFAGVAGYPVPTCSAFEVDEATRERAYETQWRAGRTSIAKTYNDLLTDAAANETAAEFVRRKIRASVRDPARAETLTPRHAIGTKRVCLDTGYYETYNQPHVRLVDLRQAPIECLTETGIRVGGEEIALDAIVYATGYDAMTGALLAMDIRGRGGLPLREAWQAGPRTQLGVMTAGFPNLFFITGPGSPSVLSNVIVCIEQHVDWIGDLLRHARQRGVTEIEPALEAQDAWVAHVNELASRTLFMEADSWYLGANVPGKPRVFMPYVGGVGPYRQLCDRVAAEGYPGFVLRSAAGAPQPAAPVPLPVEP